MLRDKKFLIAISAAILLIVFIGISRPRAIDWTASFLSEDKIPYGTYVFYNALPGIFENQDVSINNKPLYLLLHKKKFANTSLIFIQRDFDISVKERRDLLTFVAEGNNVFISAGHIHRALADILKIAEQHTLFQDALERSKAPDDASYYHSNFTNPQLHSDSAYVFKKSFFTGYYNLTDPVLNDTSSNTIKDNISEMTVLGTDALQHPTFIRIKYGQGFIYLHNNPFAFTNYYMLKPRGAEYIAKCLTYLPQSRVIVDESNKNREEDIKTPLGFVLSRESLRWAYFTALTFLLLYILFNIKRRQRIIPVIVPYRNASLEFTQTIGSLYFGQQNHKNIAQKKITYFLEFIRNRYNIDTTLPDGEFVRILAQKSGVSNSAIEHLVNVFSGIAKKNGISSTELIDLNHAIEYFKSNCQ